MLLVPAGYFQCCRISHCVLLRLAVFVLGVGTHDYLLSRLFLFLGLFISSGFSGWGPTQRMHSASEKCCATPSPSSHAAASQIHFLPRSKTSTTYCFHLALLPKRLLRIWSTPASTIGACGPVRLELQHVRHSGISKYKVGPTRAYGVLTNVVKSFVEIFHTSKNSSKQLEKSYSLARDVRKVMAPGCLVLCTVRRLFFGRSFINLLSPFFQLTHIAPRTQTPHETAQLINHV